MEKQTFHEYFEFYGDQLLHGWLRAREDGNTESFSDWVIGEYDYYLTDGTQDYEVPYHGMFDQPSKIEKDIAKLPK